MISISYDKQDFYKFLFSPINVRKAGSLKNITQIIWAEVRQRMESLIGCGFSDFQIKIHTKQKNNYEAESV